MAASFTLAAIAGSHVGKRVADRVSGPALTRAFATLLVLVAGYVIVCAVVAVRAAGAAYGGTCATMQSG